MQQHTAFLFPKTIFQGGYLMKKRIISLLLVLITVLGMFPTAAFAAATEEEALGEVDIYNGGYRLSYLSINGRIREQIYTYYNYVNSKGQTKEIPAYCVNPNTKGVPQSVPEGESIEYLAENITSDPKVMGIIANGYPHRSLGELKLENKYHAYYATKMALWCYLLPNWDIANLKVNPTLTGVEMERAQKILAAAKNIYQRGTAWSTVQAPKLTATPDRDEAYAVTINGRQYKQQVFTIHSETWVCDYDIAVSFANPDEVPEGTRIVDMDNKDITAVTTTGTGQGYAAKFKVLYPADAVAGKSGGVQLAFSADVYKYAIYYAVCVETDKYGTLQNYICDTDPTTPIRLSTYSYYGDEPMEEMETGLRIVKYQAGTTIPLGGAMFEVITPNGDTLGTFVTNYNGEINIPLTITGNYTVIEREAPKFFLLGKDTTQNVTVKYGEVAEVAFENEPYGNLRVEKYSNTGMKLPGAVVTIKHIESGVTYTAETNFNGCAIFEEIKPGAYEIVEQTAPVGWLKDDTVHTTSVAAGDTTVFSLINEELPGLRIIKYDRKNMVAMPDVTFEVFKDTVSLGKFRTDEFGEILLTDLEPGTYLAYEVDTGNDGYILDTTPQQVELTAGDGIRELLFFNDVKPGLRLVKVDSNDPSKVIPNAVFEIKSVAGDYGPEEFTTDENGEIDLSKLPAGAYVVTEKSCPGYVIDEAQRIIQLDPNEDAEFVFTNSIKPTIEIIKLSSDGSRLAGVTFRIAKIKDGSHYLDRTTNAQGEISISDLEPGVYSVKETATTANHIIDLREYHVELFPGKTSTLVVENQIRPNLYVYKHDADTGEPIANTVFIVRAADGHSVDEIRTDKDGCAELTNLLPGVYEITEKSVPSPYLLDAPSQLVTLYPNRDHTVYFENHKKPSLTVNKICSVTGDPLEGAKFQVIYASNNTGSGEINDLGYFYTDENGQFELTGLKDGWYKVTELESVPGYSIKEATQEVYIQSGTGKVLTFENIPLSALVIWKFDSVTREAVEGAVFQVKYLTGTSGTGGTVIGTYKTSANGSFTVTGLTEGTYIVEELASDSGHVIDTAPQTAYISGKDQDVVQLYFGNAPKGSLFIKKIDSVTREPLSDVKFFVTTSDGTVVGNANGYFTTDSAGSILIENINPGTTLVAKETTAKPGYVLDDTPQTARIKAGETVSLEFRNQPKGALVIVKKDAITGAPLKGVQFTITTSNGSFVPDAEGQVSSNGIYYTDATGQIVLKDLAPDTYVVKETASIPGYVPDSTPQAVVVNSSDTQTLTFTNMPKGGLVIVKKDAVTGKPLEGVQFTVTTSDGAYVPNAGGQISSNGIYYTDAAGQILLKDLDPATYVVKETASLPGYILDSTPQTVVVNSGDTQTLTFTNMPKGGLVIVKKDAVTGKPLEGVQFTVTTSDGAYVPNAGGQISSNGIYYTDSAGQILLKDLDPATYVVKETASIPGYVLDSTPQTVVVNANDTQTLTFTNQPVGGLVITKSDEDSGKRISGVQFEVRKMNGEIIGTYTTDRNGVIQLPALESGWYYVTELKAASGYIADATPQQVEVKDGQTATLELTNKKASGILLHKVDADTGEGIYGAVFLLYDRNKNPIGQYVTDQDGYIYVDEGLEDGRYYLREIKSADGYVLDSKLKTIYIENGSTTEIEWENTAVRGQIQIIKKSANYNSINGLPAGTLLQGAVFEIYDKAGNTVDTIRTDRNGRAVSKLLPLGRYTIREVFAPSYYSVNPTLMTAYLEYEGQIVTFEVENDSVSTGVSIKKTGYNEVMPGQPIKYTITGVSNTSTVPLSSFYWRDTLPGQVTLTRLVTGTYNQQLSYKIVYKTNLSGDSYRTLADNLSTTKNYVLDTRPAILGLAANEKVTEIMYVFGIVKAGFGQVETPYIYGTVAQGLSNGSSIVNVADVGGLYNGQWIMAASRWLTTVYAKTTVTLPKTGY
jgi:uncharacterized repeat protein (TIGR01451 family)